MEFLDELRDKVLALVESGSVRSLDGHLVTRRTGLARIGLQQAESELSAARFRLAAMWGNPSPQFTEAVGDLERRHPIPDIDTILQLAEDSPVTARWDAEVARGQAALSLAKANRVPDLNLGAGARWQENRNEPDYLVDIEISLPLFDRKQGDIREAHYNLARARAGKSAAETASSEVIAESYFALSEADARRLTLREEILPATRATFAAYRVAQSHIESLGDLFDARRDVTRAETEYTDALVDYHQALATLESIVGRSLAQVGAPQ
jgi:cobalt-zinc-cadmium efflux system outer membrane protein